MRDEAEGRVRSDSDNETEVQRGLLMGLQSHSQGVKPQGVKHWYEAAAWPAAGGGPAAQQAAPHRGAPGAEVEGSRASGAMLPVASSRFIHGLCSVPSVTEMGQSVCQGVGVHSVLPAAPLSRDRHVGEPVQEGWSQSKVVAECPASGWHV